MHLPALIVALAALATAPALACGPTSDCLIEDGTYRIRMPDGPPAGAIVFAHGYRGTTAGTMGNARLEAMARERGLALIAIKSADEDWTLPHAPSDGLRPARDEPAYIARVQADAVARFGLDPARMMMAGFSAGGMMTWTMACDRPDAFGAYVALSGTFWAPVPEACAGRATLHHIHGTSDTVVPIAGRAIGPARQGDVTDALAMYRRSASFENTTPFALADLDCTAWTTGGETLSYCLHPGGHSFSTDWLATIWDRTFPN